MRYAFWVDRGGTFTDCILHDRETGRVAATKVLSSDRAPLVGMRQLLGLEPEQAIPPSEIRMGTTLATNALLERRGVSSALIISKGFRDLLEIGDQTRPQLFELQIPPPERLYRRVLEIDTRAAPDGSVLSREPPERLQGCLRQLRAEGIQSLAVVVLHAYAAAELELEVRAAARAIGFDHVALSHEVAPQIGLLARAATTLLDAYLSPLLAEYLAGLQRALPGSRLWLMQSSGGLTLPEGFRAQHSFLSGPAGGVVAAAEVVRQAGLERAISFDMGGTSTDVSRYAGEYERVYERSIAGLKVLAPMLDIHTVAAGGGSLCSFDGSRFQVGPESAGAAPGPLCYGDPAAAQLTVTDLNLMLGRLQPDLFPLPLSRAPVERALEQMQQRLAEGGRLQSLEQIAQGMLKIANANMAEAIARVSVARGYDVRDHALVVFGGAGGQHACSVAELLGIEQILFHPLAGVLSAYGMGIAPITRHAQSDVGRTPLSPEALEQLLPVFRNLEQRLRESFERDGIPAAQTRVRQSLDLGYAGSETQLTLDLASAELLREDFESQHQRLFGYRRPQHAVLLTQARVQVSSTPERLPTPLGLGPEQAGGTSSPVQPSPPTARRSASFWGSVDTEPVHGPVYARTELLLGHQISGPAIVLDATGSIVVDRGFRLRVGDGGLLLVTREFAAAPSAALNAASVDPDPVQLELMGNRFMSIAQQMGEVLRRTALSTNIRERLDFSCAIFDREAALIANAPHIPVHLGAMGESVAAVRARHPSPAPGDVFVINDPAHGGSHLPDITVVTPVHAADGRLQFFIASRGHHADVGGSSPGSMPANSRTLADEGVVFRGEKIVAAGRFAREAVLALLAAGPYPARMPNDNLADLEAQIAANQRGADLLRGLTRELGGAFVERYMAFLLDYAEQQVERLLRSLSAGTYRCSDHLDDGSRLQLRLHVSDGRMQVDFRGTAAEHAGNLNAPRAVTLSAILYVLRCLIPRAIPLNSGCLRPVELILPEPSLLAPGPDRAVAAGNVETSQRVVDVLLGALGSLAASQGTMNNLTFGNASFGYYETLAGGAGAGPGFAGASAVHTHMTNTRITDVEVLEARYPVRVLEFSVRRGSGGAGRFRGGDGLVRELEFLAPLDVSIVSERRNTLPFGLCGGHSGQAGQNLLNSTPVAGHVQFHVHFGDRLRIETPGGGGYGPPLETGSAVTAPTASFDLQHGSEQGEFSVAGSPRYDLRSRGRWVWSHLARYRAFLLVSLLLVIVSNLAYAQASMFTGWAAEEMLQPGGGRLLEYSIGILVILTLDGFSNLASNYCAENIAKGFQADARQELYLSLLGKSQTFHGRQRVGDLMARATEDTSQLASMVVPGATLIVEGGLSIVIPCAYLAWLHLELLIVPVCFVISHVFALRDYMRQLQPVMHRQREGFGQLNASLEETVSGIEVVKASAREAFEREKYQKLSGALRDASVEQGVIEARYLPLFLYAVATGVMFLHCLWLHERGELRVSDVIAAMGLMGVLRFPTFISIFTFSLLQSGLASADRILTILRARTELDENAAGHTGPCRGEIRFEGVSFSYADQPVLSDLSFRVEPGQTVAIVGQTGSGKSTLTQLLNRTYDPSAGRVLIDGVDTRRWSLQVLRSNIGRIEQDIFLFSRSIADNIAFARPGATRADIERAARDAQADTFIRALPLGYDAEIGQRGATLSGGQRQRIALARAFLSDPRILILDDSTSAIDSATEDEIQQALRRIQAGRTTLLITHRLSQIRWADLILVLEQGKLVAAGNHERLLRSSPHYRRIFARYDIELPPLVAEDGLG